MSSDVKKTRLTVNQTPSESEQSSKALLTDIDDAYQENLLSKRFAHRNELIDKFKNSSSTHRNSKLIYEENDQSLLSEEDDMNMSYIQSLPRSTLSQM